MASNSPQLDEDTLLRETPFDVADCVWQLLPHTDRLSLRQACLQGRWFTDQLITTARFSLCPVTLNCTDANSGNDSDDDDSEACRLCLRQRAAATTAWDQAQANQGAFFGRMTRLKTLQLDDWPDEATLLRALRRYSPDVLGRLSALHLNLVRGAQLSTAAIASISALCPHLQELSINSNIYMSGGTSRVLCGAMFLPFHDLPLVRLTVSARQLSGNILRSIAGLSRLQRLNLAAFHAPLPQLPCLTGLVSLLHLSVAFETEDLCDHSALFRLTQLTSLHIPRVTRPLPTAAFPDPPRWAETMHQLGAMAGLLSLHLSIQTRVDDAVFDALTRLTRLTQLSVHNILLTQPGGGHLALLRELDLWGQLDANDVLHTLQPLLPLPCLERLASGRTWHKADEPTRPLCIRAGRGDSRPTLEPAKRAAALTQLAHTLAAAPRLHMPPLTLDFCMHSTVEEMFDDDAAIGGDEEPFPAVLQPTLDCIWPLAGRLRSLTLNECTAVGTDWAALASALAGLTHLELTFCHLSATCLTSIVVQITALRSLSLSCCKGVDDQAVWQQLRATCPRPVALCVVPGNPAAPPDLLTHCGA